MFQKSFALLRLFGIRVFVGSAVQPAQGRAHHTEFGLAVAFEDHGLPLPEHSIGKLIGHTARAERRGKGVPELVVKSPTAC
jgi:hypothetical protein